MTPAEVLRRRRGNGSLVAVMPEPRPRNESGPAMVQLVRRGDKLYVRAAPTSIRSPSVAQIEQRIKFGRAAEATKGVSNALMRAAMISRGLRGRKSERTVPEPLPEWARRLIAQGWPEERVREAARAWSGSR